MQVKIVLKEVTNVQYCACMNPTAGSFNITPRMQRHFVTFAVQMPSAEIVRCAALWTLLTGLQLAEQCMLGGGCSSPSVVEIIFQLKP